MIQRILLALAAPLLLTGCLLQPGSFASELTVMRDGTFGFTYRGEIQVAGMNSLMHNAARLSEADFEASCTDDEGEPRECTAEEEAAQIEAERRENEEMLEMMDMLMPGLRPNDPESVERFVSQLERQKGWNSVRHKGNGIFEVDYAVFGRTDRGFVFPVVEQFAFLNPFVTMAVRKDGKVRIDGTSLRADRSSGSFGTMAALAAMEADKKADKGEAPSFVLPDGTFTIRTDGEILTNNTEEGPGMEGGSRVLNWRITRDTESAPAALIQL